MFLFPFYIVIVVLFSCGSYCAELPVKKTEVCQIKQSVNNCAVCQEELLPSHRQSCCSKNHGIHSTCAIDMLAHNLAEGGSIKCPLCREECENEWVNSLMRPQFPALLSKLKEQTRTINSQLTELKTRNALLQNEMQAAQAQTDSEADPLFGFLRLTAEARNRELDNKFKNAVIDQTQKRMKLGADIQTEQARLNGYCSALNRLSCMAAGINYVSPFWTGFILNDEGGRSWKDRLPAVWYWGSMRNIFTQFPLYMLGRSYIDYQQYKLNMKEIESRTQLAHGWKWDEVSKALDNFKKDYKDKVIRNQIKIPLLWAGAYCTFPLIAKYLPGSNADHSLRADLIASIGAGLLGGFIGQRIGAVQNQAWFEKQKPKFGSAISMGDEREHTFPNDVPR